VTQGGPRWPRGTRRRRARGVHLGVRLALLGAATTAAVVAAAFALLSVRMRTTTRALVADQLGQGQRTLIALQRRGDQQFVAAAALLAANPNLRSAIATTRVERALGGGSSTARSAGRTDLARTVRRELERLAPDLGRDLVATTDERGRVFAAFVATDDPGASRSEPRAGADLSALVAVQHALDPTLDGGPSDLYLSVLHVGDSYFRVGVAPIVLDGFTIGTALLGERLDAARLRTLQRTFGGELLITAAGHVLASTLSPPPLGADSSDDTRPRAVRVGDVEYIVASLPVGSTQQGEPVRLTLLQAVTPTLRRTTRTLFVEFAVCGLIAMALAGFGTALLARTVLGPLEAFVRHLRASVGTSETLERPGTERWGAVAGKSQGDAPVAIEIRWLHLSFARLMASLARKRVQLAYQAYHDPLTGLPNRTRFRMEVDRALGRHTQAQDAVAVLFLDLDHFKTVNDSLGHAVGDQLLVQVAGRLLHATRGCDTVARLGGDEFAVLLDGVRTDADLLTVVERILRAMRSPIVLNRAEVLVGTSIGVARAMPSDGAEEVLRNADVAMYRAKQRGRGGYELFAPAMHAAVLERLELEADLRRALAQPEAELCLVYQPIVALDDERAVGCEALVRWEHPTRGMMSPGQFIPLAEATGLVVPLGRWVLRTACRQAAQWQHGNREVDGASRPYVSVNLSGRQLEDAAVLDDVAAAIAEARLDPSRLLLEITESTLMQRADAVLRTLHDLKALGVRLAIDDFGTGYSSLAYLQRFPVDVLKIDKAFIDGVSRGGSDAALARGIVGLAATLGLYCVAEGIERAEQAATLRAAGCGYGQGFLFGQTLAAHEVNALMVLRTTA
jgi:diguanylate cyclase (GGDEF)-like protein